MADMTGNKCDNPSDAAICLQQTDKSNSDLGAVGGGDIVHERE